MLKVLRFGSVSGTDMQHRQQPAMTAEGCSRIQVLQLSALAQPPALVMMMVVVQPRISQHQLRQLRHELETVEGAAVAEHSERLAHRGRRDRRLQRAAACIAVTV